MVNQKERRKNLYKDLYDSMPKPSESESSEDMFNKSFKLLDYGKANEIMARLLRNKD
jgi:hypothetical protein